MNEKNPTPGEMAAKACSNVEQLVRDQKSRSAATLARLDGVAHREVEGPGATPSQQHEPLEVASLASEDGSGAECKESIDQAMAPQEPATGRESNLGKFLREHQATADTRSAELKLQLAALSAQALRGTTGQKTVVCTRKLPRLMDNPNVELSGIFPPGGSNEEVKVQRVADCCRSQAG